MGQSQHNTAQIFPVVKAEGAQLRNLAVLCGVVAVNNVEHHRVVITLLTSAQWSQVDGTVQKGGGYWGFAFGKAFAGNPVSHQ